MVARSKRACGVLKGLIDVELAIGRVEHARAVRLNIANLPLIWRGAGAMALRERQQDDADIRGACRK